MKATSIYPCIWFNQQAEEAAAFYCNTFSQARILQQTPMVVTFEANGTSFMCLNGGSAFQVNSAVSYSVYCGSQAEISRLYDALSQEGSVLMPLGAYEWSKQYAWVIDRFGVNWQLDIDDINSAQKIVPTLLFANNKFAWVKTAVEQYASIFDPAKILLSSPYPAQAGLPEGLLLFAQLKLNGFLLNLMSSTLKHDFDFTPANSLVIECDNQAEIDHFWDKLGEDGRYDRCGWLNDRFGLSWQIVPSMLPQLMAHPEKGPRVMQAFMEMQKFDIQTLVNA